METTAGPSSNLLQPGPNSHFLIPFTTNLFLFRLKETNDPDQNLKQVEWPYMMSVSVSDRAL